MSNVDELGEILKQSMIAVIYKEAQLGRSLRFKSQPIRQKFKEELFRAILRLVEKADKGSLTNVDIRNEIKFVARAKNQNQVQV